MSWFDFSTLPGYICGVFVGWIIWGSGWIRE